MNNVAKLYFLGKLHEAKEALLERATFVASMLLDHKKAEIAHSIVETATEKKTTKKDNVTVDGQKAKVGRKIKLEITENNKKKV